MARFKTGNKKSSGNDLDKFRIVTDALSKFNDEGHYIPPADDSPVDFWDQDDEPRADIDVDTMPVIDALRDGSRKYIVGLGSENLDIFNAAPHELHEADFTKPVDREEQLRAREDRTRTNEVLDELWPVEKTATEDKPLIKRQTVHSLKLTTSQLVHMRDLMSVILTSGGDSLSSMLASKQNRELHEATLYRKVLDLCLDAGLPIEDEAPDFVISVSAPPELDVFQASEDIDEEGDTEV